MEKHKNNEKNIKSTLNVSQINKFIYMTKHTNFNREGESKNVYHKTERRIIRTNEIVYG